MDLKECYEKMGGDYASVSSRLPKPSLVERFIRRFLEDDSFEVLCANMSDGNRAEAFRAAHTLKGICANLGFARLFDSASSLTEELRPETDQISSQAQALLETVRSDYTLVIETIRAYFEQN